MEEMQNRLEALFKESLGGGIYQYYQISQTGKKGRVGSLGGLANIRFGFLVGVGLTSRTGLGPLGDG